MNTIVAPKVFISYSWDNDNHIKRVTELALSLRKDGIECIIDNFKDPLDTDATNWETWIDRNMQSVEYVLVVCTENYRKCFDNLEDCIGDGGVKWEADLLCALLKREAIKIQTIIFNDNDKEYIPARLSGKNRYCLSEPKFNVHDEKSGYHDMYRILTNQYKIIPNDIGEIVVLPSEKENLINKFTKFLNDESIKLQDLKDISKKFLENIYHSKLNEINTLNELIVYLDGIIIDDTYQPLTCIIKSICQEKKLHNSEIKSWLDKNYNENFCEKSKQNIELLQPKDTLLENRIILDFEKSENSNRVDLSIRYFEDGRFVSNEGKYFKDEDIDSEEFHKKVLDKIYDELYKYDHVDILLPQQFLLSDVKQWNYQDEENYIDICLTDNCCVNIHMRERAFLKSHKIKEMWESVVNQLEKPLKESMKDMKTPEEKVTKDTREVGLNYRFLPKSERNFSDRIMQKMITLRCGDPAKLDDFNQWLDDNNDLKLGQLKEEIDKSENAHMTIMWNDPSIPLKGDGIDAK